MQLGLNRKLTGGGIAGPIAEAIRAILGRAPASVQTLEISWERIADEAGVAMSAIDEVEWTNDVVLTPDARTWLDYGWALVEENQNQEIVVFRRRSTTARFVGPGGAF